MAHTHSSMHGLKMFERAKVYNDFGPTVTDRIPAHPERLDLKVERDDGTIPVSLTLLECGCVGVIHQSVIRGLNKAELEKQLLGAIDEPSKTAAEQLAELEALAAAGQDVDPVAVEVAVIQARLEATRQEAVDAQLSTRQAAELAELLEITAEPYRQSLSTSHARLQELAAAARDALVDLFEAAQEHTIDAHAAADVLTAAGAENVRGNGLGRTQSVDLHGTIHSYWPASQWTAGVLQAVQEKHRIVGGRWSRVELPRVFPGTPTP